MNDSDQRPDPDSLLERVQRAEARRRRGRLKIFFGASAGVGKTFGMLLAARERRAEGLDVVAGYVETHKRAETEQLLEGLEALPPRLVEYRDTALREFDLDAALKRQSGADPGGRIGAYQCAGFAPSQALAGCGGTAGCGYRCLYHDQRPAHRKPQRRGRRRSPASRYGRPCRTRCWKEPTRSN